MSFGVALLVMLCVMVTSFTASAVVGLYAGPRLPTIVWLLVFLLVGYQLFIFKDNMDADIADPISGYHTAADVVWAYLPVTGGVLGYLGMVVAVLFHLLGLDDDITYKRVRQKPS